MWICWTFLFDRCTPQVSVCQWMNLWRANFEDMFIRFDVIHKRDRQTDRRTDTAWQQRPRLCIASHGKNTRPRASKACELQQQWQPYGCLCWLRTTSWKTCTAKAAEVCCKEVRRQAAWFPVDVVQWQTVAWIFSILGGGILLLLQAFLQQKWSILHYYRILQLAACTGKEQRLQQTCCIQCTHPSTDSVERKG